MTQAHRRALAFAGAVLAAGAMLGAMLLIFDLEALNRPLLADGSVRTACPAHWAKAHATCWRAI